MYVVNTMNEEKYSHLLNRRHPVVEAANKGHMSENTLLPNGLVALTLKLSLGLLDSFANHLRHVLQLS